MSVSFTDIPKHNKSAQKNQAGWLLYAGRDSCTIPESDFQLEMKYV